MRVARLLAAFPLVAACGSGGASAPDTSPATATVPTSVSASASSTDVVARPESEPQAAEPAATPERITIDGAVTINLTTNSVADPVVAWIDDDAVSVARLDLESFELSSPLDVNGEVLPIAHPIERPAISIGDDDVIHLAYTSFVGTNGSVQYVEVADGVPSVPVQISGAPRPETNLVHMTQGDDELALAWLEDSTLSVALSDGGPPTELEAVDDLTCDCCNPVPVRLGDRLVVAYRNLERTADGVVRDVFVTSTDDDGATFGEPVVIADDHWFLDGCPFTGPAVARVGDELVVAWMDARQSVHPDQRETTIWVDRSTDRGATFGHDLAVSGAGIHRWPSLALDDDGTLHLIWETQGTDGGISYSSSHDGGDSFSTPTVIVERTADSGPRRAPSLIVHGDHLLVSWVDRGGAHVARFDRTALAA